MMIGERTQHLSLMTTGIQAPPWPLCDDPPSPYPVVGGTVCGSSPRNGGGGDLSPFLVGDAAVNALRRFLPSNDAYVSDEMEDGEFPDAPVDAYSCDEFRMYEFKVRRCARGRSHDWTECPYAHPGEKARRRDPRKYHYSGTSCPDFRKGNCKRGDSCEFAHGVFECWLHPAKYRTQPCKDGINCRRRVCFFAHTPEQLRVLPTQQSPGNIIVGSGHAGVDSYDGSPMRQHQFQKQYLLSTSPTSTLMSPPISPPSDSPPLSPSGGVPMLRGASVPSGTTVNELLVSLRQLQLSKGAKLSWGVGSPKMGFCGGIPTTPTRMNVMGGGGGIGLLDGWEEPVERVDRGRDLRSMVAEKLIMVNAVERSEDDAAVAPDVDWVSDLVE